MSKKIKYFWVRLCGFVVGMLSYPFDAKSDFDTTYTNIDSCDGELFDSADLTVYEACLRCFTPSEIGVEVIDGNYYGDDIEFRFNMSDWEKSDLFPYECEYVTKWRCMEGYYGSSYFGAFSDEGDCLGTIMSPCTPCPQTGGTVSSDTGAYGTGSYIGISSCYAASGKDYTGTYNYSPYCYYNTALS
ncbi:MAG: hypothetical protein IJX89_02090 [Alphaproteobacteria bacterium]|nr:hypothetical protein [Alphaproteobacteria bacterium]